MFDLLLSGFVTLFVIIDPLGLVPLFLALTPEMNEKERQRTALRACLIAFAILTIFALFGLGILRTLGITLGAFRVAGGLFLFWIAFELVFEKRNERKQRSANKAVDDPDAADVAAFPMAIPLIAGPGAISAVILLSGSLPSLGGQAALVGVIFTALTVSFAFLALAHKVDRFLGVTGRAVISRLLGVLLAALAVQFVADGAAELIRTSQQGATALS
ncbi:MarC family protein [Aurantimonas coralicida]|uniref:MarC family protein n=1 Tax=Aurantimonas coralicida TaxID=182270 RepID=UPI001D1805A0|nr:MarC family protein [Aurantimonas coralicida]MCC4298678.1 MarC family protein [Aurantimonas coralicida]